MLPFVVALIAGMQLTRLGDENEPTNEECTVVTTRLRELGEKNMTDYSIDLSVKPEVKAFFEEDSNTISYVVKDPNSNACAIVDSVMDIDYAAGRISFEHADEIIAHVRERGLSVEWLIETHAHADHLSAAPYIQEKVGGKLGIGKNITIVQDVFGKIFNEGTEFQRDGSQFDRLFDDGDTYDVGGMKAFVMAHARPHACLHDPCDRRCRLRRRHALHARWRQRAC